MVTDPVRGMEIEPSLAFATRHYKGQTFYFCSANCVQKFDADPTRYTQAPSATTGVSATPTAFSQITLPVVGLAKTSGAALERLLRDLAGVSMAHANAKAGRMQVDYDPKRVTVSDMLDVLRSAGVTPETHRLRLKVNGLYCAECVARIESAVKATPGVWAATMNASTNEVLVEYTSALGDATQLNRAIAHYAKAATVFLLAFHHLPDRFSLVPLLRTSGVGDYLGSPGYHWGHDPHHNALVSWLVVLPTVFRTRSSRIVGRGAL